MKISKIAAVCKDLKGAYLINKTDERGEVGRQFIMTRNGGALSPIDGMPTLDELSILTVFDVPMDKWSEWVIFQEDAGRFEEAMADNDESDELLTRRGTLLCHQGEVLEPFLTPYGPVLIREEYLTPIKDEGRSLEFYARTIGESKRPVIVAKVGMKLVATVNPYAMHDKEFVETLEIVAEECRREIAARERDESDGSDESSDRAG